MIIKKHDSFSVVIISISISYLLMGDSMGKGALGPGLKAGATTREPK